MTAVTVVVGVPVAAALLRHPDVFAPYGDGQLHTVMAVLRLDGSLCEIRTRDESGTVRYLDHALSDTVQVLAGPSFDAARQTTTAATATTAALAAARSRALRDTPASTLLVLYALAAAEDARGGPAHDGEIAAAAGLSDGTVKGRLRTLQAKGLARALSTGWTVVRTA